MKDLREESGYVIKDIGGDSLVMWVWLCVVLKYWIKYLY